MSFAESASESPYLEGLENVVGQIGSMATTHPNLLELAENIPNVLQSFLRSK